LALSLLLQLELVQIPLLPSLPPAVKVLINSLAYLLFFFLLIIFSIEVLLFLLFWGIEEFVQKGVYFAIKDLAAYEWEPDIIV
jgi:hypothetical protein